MQTFVHLIVKSWRLNAKGDRVGRGGSKNANPGPCSFGICPNIYSDTYLSITILWNLWFPPELCTCFTSITIKLQQSPSSIAAEQWLDESTEYSEFWLFLLTNNIHFHLYNNWSKARHWLALASVSKFWLSLAFVTCKLLRRRRIVAGKVKGAVAQWIVSAS